MPMPASPTTPEPVAEASNTCRYPSKKCWNARALKRNGEMHNLCDEHRQKANKNQRRLEQKRKTSKKVTTKRKSRKSRTLKSKSSAMTTTRATKRQQQQQVALELATAALSLQQHQLNLQQAPLAVQLTPAMPTGFFTDLMLSESLFAKPQSQPLDQRLPSMSDFLEGDLDSLTDCLDYSMPAFASMSTPLLMGSGCGMAMGNGSSSPIDVCDGLDAVAAVNDFWWHPVLTVDPPLLDPSALTMGDEIFSFQQH